MKVTDAAMTRRVTPVAQFLVWSALVVPIGAWTVHIILIASLAHLSCSHPGLHWVMHASTAALALITIAAMAVAWHYARLPNGEDAGSATASLRFLSHVALIVGAANLLLILVEGSYVVFLPSCARA
jgi:hypothetical protein